MKYLIGLVCLTALAVSTAIASGAADNLIGSSDIQNRSIRGGDIQRHTLSLSLLKETTVAELTRRVRSQLGNGGQGPQGPQGPRGADGAQGPQGNPGTPGKDAKVEVTNLAAADNPSSPGDWFGRNSTCGNPGDPVGSIAIGSAPGGPSGSDAAIYTLPNGDGGNAFSEARTRQFDGLSLKDITEFAYTERFHGGGGTGAAPYVFINLDNGHALSFAPAYQDGNYFSTPDQGAPTENQWQDYDLTKGAVGEDGGVPVSSFKDYVANNPDAKIVPTSAGGGVRFLDGCAGAGSENSTGAVDNIRVTIAGQRKTFDFENASQ